MEFVDVENAQRASGLRLVLLKGAPSPWSQAAKALVEIKGIEAVGVWMTRGDAAIHAWTGIPNAPVALYGNEPPRACWSEILALLERLAPARPLVPADLEQRIRMMGLAHELMGQQGLVWNLRLMLIELSLATGGERGFPLAFAQHLAARYGYREGCAAAARAQVTACLAALGQELQRAHGGPYYFGEMLTALDVYSAAAMDTLLPLPEEQCPMHPVARRAFEARREELEDLVPSSLLAHRELMHQMHMPLPMVL